MSEASEQPGPTGGYFFVGMDDEWSATEAAQDLVGAPPKCSFYIGRWQPLHEGHIRLIQTALDEGRKVVIGIMDTPISERNPHSFQERMEMFWDAFGPDVMGYDAPLQILKMPWIDEVVYGRDCGWRCRRIRLDAETEQNHSGTAIRANGGTG